MIRLRIDNIELEAAEGSLIIEAAESAGIAIPVLCHRKGVQHWASCMVCIVRDETTGSFIPSCSSLVREGMIIDSSGDEVLSMRKKALELLLSEHRAECEAPCRIVCPSGYNIPVMNRFLSSGNIEGARKLIADETSAAGLKCISCPAYCENACRRKKIDEAISIRNIRIFIYREINPKNIDTVVREPITVKKIKQFSSRTGKLEPVELREWLKECTATQARSGDIPDMNNASSEAASCMHCDCRAATDCRLRELASVYQIKDSGTGKVINGSVAKKINYDTGLVFENAKCIKCGLCVRVCEDSNREPGLCFINRGFVSIISEPLTAGFSDILKTQSEKVIEVCPTGALSRFK